jgi:hypothetical protein
VVVVGVVVMVRVVVVIRDQYWNLMVDIHHHGGLMWVRVIHWRWTR